MTDYYLFQNQQQVGPFTRGNLLGMLQAGTASNSDLAWRTGLDAWCPLGELLDLRSSITNQREANWNSGYRASPARTRVSWIPAVAFQSIFIGFLSLFALVEFSGDDDLVGMLALMSLPFLAAAIVFWAILHYQCWKALPAEHAATTPGKAIGFLFIPLFNFYWAFVSWPKLAEGFNRLQVERRGAIRLNLWPMALGNAIFFVLSLIFTVLFPEETTLDLLLAIGSFIVFILFYRAIVRLANSL